MADSCSLSTRNCGALLGGVVLFSYGLDQDLQRFYLSLREQAEFCAEEHEVLESRVEMRRHVQGLECAEEAGIDDSVHAKKATENLATERGELRSLEDAQGLGLVVVVWEFALIVDLLRYPRENLLDVDRGGDGDGVARLIGPSVLHARWKPLTWSERIEVGIGRHDGPDRADVVVEVDGMDGDPCGA